MIAERDSSPSASRFAEGAAEWSATGLENRGSLAGLGFDSSTFRHLRRDTQAVKGPSCYPGRSLNL